MASTLHLSPLRHVIQDEAGNVMHGATVTIWQEATGALAPQCVARDGSGKGNPFVAADGGDLDCYLPAGRYRIRAQLGAYVRVWRDVQVGTYAQYDFGTQLAHQGETGAWRADVSYASGVLVSHTVLGSLPFAFVSRHPDNLGNPPTIGGDLALAGGTPFGDLDQGGGLNAAFNGAASKANTACASSVSTAASTARYIGLDFGEARPISYAVVYGSNNQGFVNSANPSATLSLYGANSAPANATDGTLLGSLTFTDTANESAGRIVTATVAGTTWRYVWIVITHADGTSRVLRIALVQFRGPHNLYGQSDEHWTVIGLSPPGQLARFAVYVEGRPRPGMLVWRAQKPADSETLAFPEDLAGSHFEAEESADEESVWALSVDGADKATITWPAGETVATVAGEAFDWTGGQVLRLHAANPRDATLADVSGWIAALRTSP